MDIFSAKFIFLALVAMVVLGPERLATALRGGGRLLGEYRRISIAVTQQTAGFMSQAGLDQPLAELRGAAAELRRPLQEARASVGSGFPPAGSFEADSPLSATSVETDAHLHESATKAPRPVVEDQPVLDLGWH